MSAILIAVVAALVFAQALPAFAGALRRYGWFDRWLQLLGARMAGHALWEGSTGVALALLPPVLAAGLLQLALQRPLLGLGALLFDIAVLVYTWGPRDLDADVAAVADARDTQTRRRAACALWPEGTSPTLEGGALIEAVFRSALRRWFGVLLWYLVLGAAGALLYRLSAQLVESPAGARLFARTRMTASRWLAMLEWPVAQLMTLALALVGNFDAVLRAWREGGGTQLRLDRNFLGAAARASVRSELAEEAAEDAEDFAHESGITGPPPVRPAAPGLPELRDAMSLVWRCLLVWLATLALFVIAGWVS